MANISKIEFSEIESKYILNTVRDCSNYLIIENFPNSNDFLLDFSFELGYPMVGGDLLKSKSKASQYIYEVKELEEPKYDIDGLQIISTTNLEFPLHTDCSYVNYVPDLMLLYCVNTSQIGGQTTLLDLQEIIKSIDKRLLQILQQPIFPFRFGYSPIISKNLNQEYTIRYNYSEIELTIKNNFIELDNKVVEAISQFNNFIETHKSKITISLSKNDLLITRNNKTLHGRTSFEFASDRLMKRLRLTSKKHLEECLEIKWLD